MSLISHLPITEFRELRHASRSESKMSRSFSSPNSLPSTPRDKSSMEHELRQVQSEMKKRRHELNMGKWCELRMDFIEGLEDPYYYIPVHLPSVENCGLCFRRCLACSSLANVMLRKFAQSTSFTLMHRY